MLWSSTCLRWKKCARSEKCMRSWFQVLHAPVYFKSTLETAERCKPAWSLLALGLICRSLLVSLHNNLVSFCPSWYVRWDTDVCSDNESLRQCQEIWCICSWIGESQSFYHVWKQQSSCAFVGVWGQPDQSAPANEYLSKANTVINLPVPAV